jgi:hypothetical protein
MVVRLVEPDLLRLLDLNDPTIVNDDLNQAESQRTHLLPNPFQANLQTSRLC